MPTLQELNDGKLICIVCTKSFSQRAFYSHRNNLINDCFSVCKKCVQERVNLDKGNTLIALLQLMDMPLLEDTLEGAIDNSKDTIGIYMKDINSLKQHKGLKFLDSDMFNKDTLQGAVPKKGKSAKADTTLNGEDITYEGMLEKWGVELDMDEYLKLERIFRRVGGENAFDEVEESEYIALAKTEYRANLAFERGDSKEYSENQKMATTMRKAMVQKNALKKDGEEAFGVFIKKIEDDEPLDTMPERYDSEFMRKYVDGWFVTQVKRIFNQIRDEDVEFVQDEFFLDEEESESGEDES